MGTFDHRKPAGNLAHGCEKRQRPIRCLHGLVGDRRRARSDKRIRQRAIGRQMQVGEECEVTTENPSMRRRSR